LRKTRILLRAFEAARKNVEYCALDLSLSELARAFAQLDTSEFRYVSLQGWHGTYGDALSKLKNSRRQSPREEDKPTCIMILGSSIGNMSPENVVQFVSDFREVVEPSGLMLIGLDACQQPDRVFRAYNDSRRVTEKFYWNGLVHANRLLDREIFREDDWLITGSYDVESNKYEAWAVALVAMKTEHVSFEGGQRIHLEDAFKYAKLESDQLFRQAGFIPRISYGNDYCTWRVPRLVRY